MPSKRVTCIRNLAADPDSVWAVLGTFDLNWHPLVAACTLTIDTSGAVLRDFETTDGGRLLEQRTYLSNHDRVLCYSALSGIEGALGYTARVKVADDGDRCCITWEADILAGPERLGAIAEGTRAVFEAGLDSLAAGLPDPISAKHHSTNTAEITRHAIPGTPHLSYLTSGAAPTTGATLVLCLHGIGGQAANWSEQIQAFGTDYTIAAMDFRGYGGSTLGVLPTQVDDHCDDILALADRFGAEKLVLVGLSMGAWIATSFAMRHGDRLAGLVLVGGCTGMSEAAPAERAAFRASREVPLSQGQTPADFADAVVDIIAGPHAGDGLRARLHQSMSDIPAETYRDALRCFCNPPERFEFAKIFCPVLMVTGAHDRLAPPTEIRDISTRILADVTGRRGRADVCFEVLAEAGHLCNIEQPAPFNRLLGRFLRRLPGVARAYKPSRAEKQRQKRDRILEAAHGEFCSAGFDGASMDRLARAAGVSKPTLYHYFGDKEGLFAAVLDRGRAHIIAPLLGAKGTLVERLWRFAWTYAAFVLRPDMLSLARLILGEAGRRPESASRYHQSGPAQAFEGLVAFVSAAQARGELSVDDAALAAHDLWSLILSGPRDYYLHHVAARPSQTELLRVIGHGLGVFLKVYSCHLATDEKQLSALIEEKQSRLAFE